MQTAERRILLEMIRRKNLFAVKDGVDQGKLERVWRNDSSLATLVCGVSQHLEVYGRYRCRTTAQKEWMRAYWTMPLIVSESWVNTCETGLDPESKSSYSKMWRRICLGTPILAVSRVLRGV